MSELIISVSGLRGIIGETLTPEAALRYVAAFAQVLPPGPVVVTRDTRISGPMLSEIVRGTLMAAGRTVIDAQICATPTTGVLVREFEAAGGVQISASHNPPAYNGLKLFDREGKVLPAEAGEFVVQRYRQFQPAWVGHDQLGQLRGCENALRRHAELVLACVDVERIRRHRFKVLLDANHGAGSLLGLHLLNELNCTVAPLGETPDGRFSHPPEPTAENLADVCLAVQSMQADVGFCQDPDADRLAVIDERGRYIGEEYTLALCLDHVLRQRPGPIVTNCATSRMAEDLAEKYGVPFFRSPVGEANVVQLMQQQQAVFGGEGNGGPIDPRVGYVRDSFVGMALVLDAMAARDTTVGAIADELPRYVIEKAKTTLPADRVPRALTALEKHFQDATSSRMDGLRLDWPGRWLLVRASNTEPIVRIIAEADSADTARQLCAEADQVIRQLNG